MKKGSLIQFIKFGLVGVSNTVVNYLVYIFFIYIGVHYVIANILGFLISVLNAFYWGNRFVFKEDKTKEKRVWWQVLLKTYVSYSFGMVINTLLLVLWIDILNIGQYFGFVGSLIGWFSGIVSSVFALFGSPDVALPSGMAAKEISEIIGPILNMFITVPINFLANKFWAYRQKPAKNTGNQENQDNQD